MEEIQLYTYDSHTGAYRSVSRAAAATVDREKKRLEFLSRCQERHRLTPLVTYNLFCGSVAIRCDPCERKEILFHSISYMRICA